MPHIRIGVQLHPQHTSYAEFADAVRRADAARYQEIRYEMDRAHAKDCGPRRPGEPICDPAIPVREVRIGRAGLEGGLFRPAFATAGLP